MLLHDSRLVRSVPHILIIEQILFSTVTYSILQNKHATSMLPMYSLEIDIKKSFCTLHAAHSYYKFPVSLRVMFIYVEKIHKEPAAKAGLMAVLF